MATRDAGGWYVCTCRDVMVQVRGNPMAALPWRDSRGDRRKITFILC